MTDVCTNLDAGPRHPCASLGAAVVVPLHKLLDKVARVDRAVALRKEKAAHILEDTVAAGQAGVTLVVVNVAQADAGPHELLIVLHASCGNVKRRRG